MRILGITVCLATLALLSGCSNVVSERKQPIAMDKIPPEIIKIAQDKYPDVVFETAFTEVEQGQDVYEIKGKAKSGKIIEVEVTKDGKLLN
jgi:uncharacterized protein YceK